MPISFFLEDFNLASDTVEFKNVSLETGNQTA